MNWKDFLSFRKMITPLIIQVLFWIGVVVSIIWGLIVMFGGLASGIGLSQYGGNGVGAILGSLCAGPIVIVLGILFSRIYAELLILFFRMNDNLNDIKDELQKPK